MVLRSVRLAHPCPGIHLRPLRPQTCPQPSWQGLTSLSRGHKQRRLNLPLLDGRVKSGQGNRNCPSGRSRANRHPGSNRDPQTGTTRIGTRPAFCFILALPRGQNTLLSKGRLRFCKKESVWPRRLFRPILSAILPALEPDDEFAQTISEPCQPLMEISGVSRAILRASPAASAAATTAPASL